MDRAAALPPGVAPIVGDLAEPKSVIRHAWAADAIVNLGFAAHGADWAALVTVESAFHRALTDALAGSGKTLIVTNGTIFLGDSGAGRLAEDAPVVPDHPAAVRAASTAVALNAAVRGLRPIELRVASFVYGCGGSVLLPALIAAARRDGRSIRVGDGATVASTLHVEAAASAFVLALNRGEPGEVFHLAGDEEPTIADIARAVGIGTGTAPLGVSPDDAAAATDPFTTMFLRTNNRLDSAKARRVLGWSGAHPHALLWDVAHGSYAADGV